MSKSALPNCASRLVVVMLAASGFAALAQAPNAAPKARTGYAPVTLMNRDDVRILRVEIEPGGVRAVHKHDDVKFHLFIPVAGSIELTMGSDAPVAAPPGQAFYLAKGTMHGFRNTGSTPAAVIEVFVKEAAPAAADWHNRQSPGGRALADRGAEQEAREKEDSDQAALRALVLAFAAEAGRGRTQTTKDDRLRH